MALDAIVLAASPHAKDKLLGITLAERGVRVARRAGARRIILIDGVTDNAELTAWVGARDADAELLVLRAGDQVVHPPLAKAAIDASGERRVVRDTTGELGGALVARGAAIDEVVAAVVADPANADRAIVEGWGDRAHRVTLPPDTVAFHAARTPAEKRAAKRLLLSLLVKASEDSPVSRYVYRPLSRPLTQLLLHTGITPNQVSYFVGVLGLTGCVLTAMAGQTTLIVGALLVFLSCVIDGCDGEIARMKLLSSPFGAWLDTVIDEITQVSYFVAIGYHTYAAHPHPMIAASIVVGFVCFVSTIFSIYWFCIVIYKAGGSQYYTGDLEIVDGPDGKPTLRARSKTSSLPGWAKAFQTLFLYMIRRDFINLAALGLALANQFEFIYSGILIGTIVAAVITVPEHFKLRRQLREVVAGGGVPGMLR